MAYASGLGSFCNDFISCMPGWQCSSESADLERRGELLIRRVVATPQRTARKAPPCAGEVALVAVPTQLRASLSERCSVPQRTGLASTNAPVPAEAHRERESPRPRSRAAQPQAQPLLSPKHPAHTYGPPCYALVTSWPSPRMAAALRADWTLCSAGRGWGAGGPMPVPQLLSPTASGVQHRRRCAVPWRA
jgi:hypothetical protein